MNRDKRAFGGSDLVPASLMDAIYSAAFEPERWRDVVDAASDALGGVHTTLHGSDVHTGQCIDMASALYPEEAIAHYVENWATRNPWTAGLIQMPLERATAAEEVFPREQLLKSDFYDSFLRPLGEIGTGVAIVLHRGCGRNLAMTCNMTLAREDLRESAAELMQRMGPHVQRAFRMRRALRTDCSRLAFETLASTTRDAALICVEETGRVAHTNAMADALFAEGTLALGADRLIEVSGGGQSRLAAAIAEGAAADIPITAASGATLLLTVIPVPGAQRREIFDWVCEPHRPRALLLVTDPSRLRRPDLSAAVALYGLSPAERELACALCAGVSVAEHAAARGISERTARNQLVSIFDKTGARRQSDLVLRLLRAESPLS